MYKLKHSYTGGVTDDCLAATATATAVVDDVDDDDDDDGDDYVD